MAYKWETYKECSTIYHELIIYCKTLFNKYIDLLNILIVTFDFTLLGAASTSEIHSSEDGIHAEHVIGAFTCGLIVGVLVAILGVYIYMKRKSSRRHTHVSRQLIPVKPNTYVDESEWKNNFTSKVSPQKIPLREATIKRNGNLRAQLQADNFWKTFLLWVFETKSNKLVKYGNAWTIYCICQDCIHVMEDRCAIKRKAFHISKNQWVSYFE